MDESKEEIRLKAAKVMAENEKAVREKILREMFEKVGKPYPEHKREEENKEQEIETIEEIQESQETGEAAELQAPPIVEEGAKEERTEQEETEQIEVEIKEQEENNGDKAITFPEEAVLEEQDSVKEDDTENVEEKVEKDDEGNIELEAVEVETKNALGESPEEMEEKHLMKRKHRVRDFLANLTDIVLCTVKAAKDAIQSRIGKNKDTIEETSIKQSSSDMTRKLQQLDEAANKWVHASVDEKRAMREAARKAKEENQEENEFDIDI